MVAGFAWHWWQPSCGPRGRLHVDWVAGIRGICNWERFLFHDHIQDALRSALNVHYPDNSLIETYKNTIKEHNKGWLPLFKDRYLMQHWLWEGVFTLITLLGIYLLTKTLCT